MRMKNVFGDRTPRLRWCRLDSWPRNEAERAGISTLPRHTLGSVAVHSRTVVVPSGHGLHSAMYSQQRSSKQEEGREEARCEHKCGCVVCGCLFVCLSINQCLSVCVCVCVCQPAPSVCTDLSNGGHAQECTLPPGTSPLDTLCCTLSKRCQSGHHTRQRQTSRPHTGCTLQCGKSQREKWQGRRGWKESGDGGRR